MTKILSDEDEIKVREIIRVTPEEAIRQLKKRYEAMLRGERLEPEFRPWPHNQPVEQTADILRHCACHDGNWNKYCPIHGLS